MKDKDKLNLCAELILYCALAALFFAGWAFGAGYVRHGLLVGVISIALWITLEWICTIISNKKELKELKHGSRTWG